MKSVWLLVLLLILFSSCVCYSANVNPASSGPWLVYDYSIGWGMGVGGKPGGVLFEVQISDSGQYKTVYKSIYSALKWYPYAMNLGQYSGKHIKIRLLTQHIENRINMDYPYWGNPRIVTGPLDGSTKTKDIISLAMTKADRVGGILEDGTNIDLNEPDPIFNLESPGKLITPAMINREHMVMVLGGDSFITVPGKAQPGLYMGVSMGVDYLRIGADPNCTDYTGPMPAKAYAEWEVDVPVIQETAKHQVKSPAVKPQFAGKGAFLELASKEDKYLYQPGLISKWDSRSLTLEANMGPSAKLGWAFAGVETVGRPVQDVLVTRKGEFDNSGPNNFAGIVVDYHTVCGYQKRVFLGLGAGSDSRYDLRPGGWIYDDASMSRLQRLTAVTAYMDISSELKTNSGKIKLPLAKYAPEDWDGRVWIAAGVQNQPQDSGIKLQLLGVKPYIPNSPIASAYKLSAKFVSLKSDRLVLAVSKVNGALCGVWNRKTGLKIAQECSDQYLQERLTSIASSTERYDKVLSVTSEKDSVTVICSNPAFSGLKISKCYKVKPDGLFTKTVGFSTDDKEGFFIKYICNTTLDPAFLKLTPGGGTIEKKQVVAQGKVVEATEEVAPEQAGAGDAPIVITTDGKSGISAYRYKVNGRYVMRGQSSRSRTGWNLKVFSDYIKKGQSAYGQTQWFIFSGDLATFNRHYLSLPEYKEVFNTPKPEWNQRILSDAMCLQNGTEAFHHACEPYLVTDTIWFFNSPWGNWGSYHDNPNKNHPDVYGIARGFRSGMPNARIGKYNNFSFDKTSDVYKQHPEYGVRDRDGELLSSGINSDSSRGASFYFQILNPVVRRALKKMHTEQLRDWNFDFFYTDGPGFGQEELDWGIRDVTQNYDWLAYCKELKSTLQQVNPDCAWFVNGMLPGADIGYIEYRDEQWKTLGSPKWQGVARELFNAKFNEPTGFLIVPTYGNTTADPEMSAYVILYGWCGHGNDINRLPWMRAAMEYRGMRLVDDAVEPKWYKVNSNLEAYGFRKGSFGIVNFMDHNISSRRVTVTVDLNKLGISGKVYTWILQMNQPYTEMPDPADQTRTIRNWVKTAYNSSLLTWGKPMNGRIKLEVPTAPKLLTSVIFSKIPVVMESVDGFVSESGLPSHHDVDIKTNEIKDGILLNINCRAGSASILLPEYDMKSFYIMTSQQVCDAQWCGMKALRISVARGVHKIKITKRQD